MAIKDLRNLNEAKIKLSEAKELLENEGFVVAKDEIEIDEASAVELVKGSGYTVLTESEVEEVEEAMKEKVFEEFDGLVIAEDKIDAVEEAMKEKVLEEFDGLVIAEADIESVEEAMKEKVVENLKEEGYQILDEEMLDAIDEELEAMVAERVEQALEEMSMGEGELPKALKDAIAKKKEEEVAGDEDGKKPLIDKEGNADPKKDGKVSEEDDKDADDAEGDEDKDKDGEEQVPVKKESTKEAFLENLIGEKLEPAERATKKSFLESLSE